MGISGLLPLLKSITVDTHIKHSAGQVIGVDAYVWLHRGAFSCAQDLVLEKPTTKYVDYAMHRVKMLLHYGVTPYIVFDGDYLPSKAGTEKERETKRAENIKAGKQAMYAGNKKLAQEHFQRAIDITPEMALKFIQALRDANIQYVVAPYEADAQLAYLDKTNIIDGVVTEDSDLLVFGCKKVLYKLNEFGECREILLEKMGDNKALRFDGWTPDMFRYMAILSGCDYLASMPGMGLKTAHQLVRRYRTLDKLFQGLRMEHGNKMPVDYEAKFRRADQTFVHQVVFCPLKKSMVHLVEPVRELDDIAIRLVGCKHDDELARAIADGSVNPITKKVIDQSRQRPALRQTQSTPVTKTTIDKFLVPSPLQPRNVNISVTPKRMPPRLTPREEAHAKKLRLFESSPDKFVPKSSVKENRIALFFKKDSKEDVPKINKEDEDLARAIEASKADEAKRQMYEGYQNPIAFQVDFSTGTGETSNYFDSSVPGRPDTTCATPVTMISGLPSPPDSQTAPSVANQWRDAYAFKPSTPATPVPPSLVSSLRRLGGQALRKQSTSQTPKSIQRRPFFPISQSQDNMKFFR